MLPAERSRRHNARSSFVDANQTLFELSIATKIRRLRSRVVYITEQEEGQQEARDRQRERDEERGLDHITM